jgi:hypothetical protein
MPPAIARLLITIVTTTLISCSTQSQSVQTGNQRQPKFATPAEREDYWAAQLFQNEYYKQRFEKFKGTIKVSGDSLNYPDGTIVVKNTAEQCAFIFGGGLFYPGIITAHIKATGNSGQDLNTPVSFTVSNFEELTFLSKNVRQKRFRFWLFVKGFCNPVVCFMELTNDKANNKTDIKSFIKGASLTFFKNAWPVI